LGFQDRGEYITWKRSTWKTTNLSTCARSDLKFPINYLSKCGLSVTTAQWGKSSPPR
jgi:hypothetical protein